MLGVRMMMATAGTAVTTPLYVDDVFSAYTYTGNGSTQTITNGIDLAGEGGMVWVKSRSGARNHALFDTAQSAGDYIQTNLTDAKYNTADGIQNFSSTGFSVQGSGYPWNNNAETYASWTFRKAPKFFDVVTYTGDGVTGYTRQIQHSLGVQPGFIVIKRTDSTSDWHCFHRGTGAPDSAYATISLNTTAAASGGAVYSQNVATSTYFCPWYIQNAAGDAHSNINGATYVAYLFAHDTSAEGMIQCGSFDGTVGDVTLGWEPQFILVKRSTLTDNWTVMDIQRRMDYGDTLRLFANTTDADTSSGGAYYVPTPTGFKFFSESSGTHIYMAIRRPNKPPTVGTQVYNAIARTGTGAAATVTGVGFAPDLVLAKKRSAGAESHHSYDRLRGSLRMLTSDATYSESSNVNGFSFYSMDGVSTAGADAGLNANTETYINHFFRRAPGFFDEVCYTGTGAAHTEGHNLGVAPELVVVKYRNSSSYDWHVTSTAIGQGGRFNTNGQFAVGWKYITTQTATTFTMTSDPEVNQNNGTYVAYLFATLAGISKVGSYTGTAATLQINCGFTTGARFVLIKRTDSTGDWYVWDTVRGIIAGNDPYLLLNSTAAEVTSTDYIDPYSAGFEISSTAPATINASGGTYIYLAIA